MGSMHYRLMLMFMQGSKLKSKQGFVLDHPVGSVRYDSCP